MEIKIKISEKHIGILEYLTLILAGIFITSIVFALLTKPLGEFGVYLGILLCGAIVFCGFYYVEKGTKLRAVTWGILGTLIFCTVLFIVALEFISSALQNL
jgi:hypothetical protein